MRPLRGQLCATAALVRWRPLRLGLGVALGLCACGDKSLKQRKEEDEARVAAQFGHLPPKSRPTTEAQKIETLIDRVRHSGHTFMRNGQEHSSEEAAEHMSMKLERAGDRVRTAEEFIAGVASRSSITGQSYRLVTAEGVEYSTRDWLLTQLREIEQPPPSPEHAVSGPNEDSVTAPAPSPHVEATIDVDFALALIERSGLTFLAPREGDDPVVYTSGEFSRMLRRKGQWLGPDLEGLDPWLDEIASRSFKTDLPYQVRLETQRQVELRPWLEAKLAEARKPAPDTE